MVFPAQRSTGTNREFAKKLAGILQERSRLFCQIDFKSFFKGESNGNGNRKSKSVTGPDASVL